LAPVLEWAASASVSVVALGWVAPVAVSDLVLEWAASAPVSVAALE
jgi:hypothetical protein